MTAHRHLKVLVRDRMRKTGESYAAARRHVVRQASLPAPSAAEGAHPWHLPGSVPATTALRILLSQAGIRAAETGELLTEPMLFGIAGGIGIGMFTFLYEKENCASFFIAGRHLWHDDQAYLQEACRRFGVETVIRESGGARTAEQQLREVLSGDAADGKPRPRPCIAWVDAANLPHRAMPAMWSGGGYHIVTVYDFDESTGTALIGDLSDTPIPIALADLARARERIKKQKNRLLALAGGEVSVSLAQAIPAGLRACHEGLTGAGGIKNARTNFSLECLKVWATRMHGSTDRERWEVIFPPPRLSSGLNMMADFIEHYGTGGGLCRPIFAEFLDAAADALGDPRLHTLSQRYAEIGRAWSDLARAALPEDVPLFRRIRELQIRRAELVAAGAPPEEVRAVWDGLGALAAEARASFPLSDAECAALCASLQGRVAALYEGEKAAHAELGAWLN